MQICLVFIIQNSAR